MSSDLLVRWHYIGNDAFPFLACVQLTAAFDEIWMTIAALLPIFTIVACVKAAPLRLTWRPVLGWGLVVVAFALNALFYRVIADTLR